MSRDLVILAVSLLTWGVGESMFLLFQPLYLQQLGASPIGIGAILGGWAVAMAVVHIPAGYLADRIGRRPLLWMAWISGLVAAWIMALAPGLPVFVVGLLLYGLTSFVVAPLNSYITAGRGRWSVGRALTLISAAFNLGAILGPLLGGAVAERVGLHAVYVIAGCIFILSTVLILFLRPQPLERSDTGEKPGRLPLNARYTQTMAVIFLAVFAMYLPQPLTPNFLQNQRLLNFTQIGLLGGLSSLGVVIMNLGIGHLPARLGFLLGQASVGLFSLLLWRGTGMLWFAGGYFLLGGYRTARSLAAAQTGLLVSGSQMGLAYGLTEFISSTAAILAPPLAGILYQQDPISVYPASLALIALSILLGIAFMPTIIEQKGSAITTGNKIIP